MVYPKIKELNLEVCEYLPDYGAHTKDYLPPKQFMWDIFHTLDPDTAEEFIKFAMAQRSKEKDEGDRTIDIDKDVWNEIKSMQYYSKKKGKALFMLKASKQYKFGLGKRKRHQMELYDPNKEECKTEMSGKRVKRDDDMDPRTPSSKPHSAVGVNLNEDFSQRSYLQTSPVKRRFANPFSKQKEVDGNNSS